MLDIFGFADYPNRRETIFALGTLDDPPILPPDWSVPNSPPLPWSTEGVEATADLPCVYIAVRDLHEKDGGFWRGPTLAGRMGGMEQPEKARFRDRGIRD